MSASGNFTLLDRPLPGTALIEARRFGDERGFFMETWSRRDLAALGIHCDFVQDNHSRSRRGVLRGIHYQRSQTQAKLVRVSLGAVWDVAVDLRLGSPTFGRWAGVELSAENGRLFYIPQGFAHGFYVLSEIAEFSYKCSDYYAPACERGLRWDDPALGIDWRLVADEAPLVSTKDAAYPSLDQLPATDLFSYEKVTEQP